MWNWRFYLLCLLHLQRRRCRKRRERELWEHPIVAARTLEGTYYTVYGRLREDERKFFNYFRMSTSTFDYIVDRLAPHLGRQNTMMRESIRLRQMIAVNLRLVDCKILFDAKKLPLYTITFSFKLNQTWCLQTELVIFYILKHEQQ
jgi:hypothetical protein